MVVAHDVIGPNHDRVEHDGKMSVPSRQKDQRPQDRGMARIPHHD